MQHRARNHALKATSLVLGLLVAVPAHAASLQQVNDWGASGVPSYVKMYIYVPDRLATKPPILVSAHSCGSTATGQMGNIPKTKAAADANGFILILPDNPGQNCWDVGEKTTSLKHDAGGDTKAVVQMVKYALGKYNGDASRVYAFGGSSGAMLTQALLAVYPDVFRAGSARAGVPAGCWAEGYATSNQWSDSCADGNVTKTAQQWGDLVRAMYPGYTGHRPRLQIIQGDNDETISFKNSAEAIKEWTNVLGLSTAPSSTDTLKTSVSTYNRQFWKNACDYIVFETWAGQGGKHSMGYEEDAILEFLGLDVAGGADPEPNCPAAGTGTGGSGAAGNSSAGGNSSVGASTGSGGSGGSSGSSMSGVAGSPSAAGAGPVVGNGGNGVVGASGAGSGVAGGVATAGAPVTNGTSGAPGTTHHAAGSPGAGSEADSGGCALVAVKSKSMYGYAAVALGLTLLSLRRRRRSARD